MCVTAQTCAVFTQIHETRGFGSTRVRAATANRKFRVFLTISWTDGDERTAPRKIVAKFEQRTRCSPHAVIRVHDSDDNVIEAHKHADELKSRTTVLLAGCRAFD